MSALPFNYFLFNASSVYIGDKGQMPMWNKEHFEKLVHEAFKNYTNTGKLLTSPLLQCKFVDHQLKELGQEDHPMTRLEALRQVLLKHVQHLKPNPKKYPIVTSERWQTYNILYYRYIKGMNKRNRDARIGELEALQSITPAQHLELLVLEWLFSPDCPSSSSYYSLRKGSYTIANLLFEEEQQLSEQ